MFDELNRLAGWSLNNLPRGQSVLLSDTNGADASLLIHHFTSAYVKAGDRQVILVTLAQTFPHYHVAASKISSVSLQRARESGSLRIIDRLTDGPDEYLAGKDSFQAAKDLYTDVERAITACSGTLDGGLVLVDDLTSLLCVGCPRAEIANLVRHLVALCKQRRCTLVTLVHRDIDHCDDDDEVSLYDACSLFFDTEMILNGLSSGHSKDVNGHLQLVRKRLSVHGRTVYEESPVQHYRVTDRRLQMFAPGTSRAVL